MKPSRSGGGTGGSGGSRSHSAMKCAVNGPIERRSVRLRPDRWIAAASSGHMSAERDARRNARCFRPSLRSASRASSSAVSRLGSGGLLVGVEKRHVGAGSVRPVGIVRELYGDAEIAPLAARIIDLDQSLAGL